MTKWEAMPCLPRILLLPALLGACSAPPDWAGNAVLVGGVEVVSNPGEPLLGGAQPVATEIWSVQGPDWVNPTLVHAHVGFISVIDPPANEMHLLSPAGEHRGSLGRAGGGPGEFINLLDAHWTGDGFAVLDAGKGGVEYLDRNGTYISSVHLQGQVWRGFLLNGGALLLQGEFLSDPRAESSGDWVNVDERGEPANFTSVTLQPLPEEEGASCSSFSPWAGGAARLRFTTPQIQIFDPAGSLLRESFIALPVEAVSESERQAALDELRRSLSARGLPAPFVQQSLVVSEERWRVKCRFGPLRFDSGGRSAAFLEQNPDRFGSGNATLHFISKDGVYLARVPFPTPWRDFALKDGVVYALTRDPLTDVVSLTAYRVDLPTSLFDDAALVLEEARRRGAEAG